MSWECRSPSHVGRKTRPPDRAARSKRRTALDTVPHAPAAGVCVSVFRTRSCPASPILRVARCPGPRRPKTRARCPSGVVPVLPGARSRSSPFSSASFRTFAARYAEPTKKAPLSRRYKDALAEKVRRIRDRHGSIAAIIEYRPDCGSRRADGVALKPYVAKCTTVYYPYVY